MGQITEPVRVMPMLVAFSRYAEARDWGRQQAEADWGPIELISPPLDFTETVYYEPSMGDRLEVEIVAFSRLMQPEELIARKRQTNAWEAAYAKLGRHAQSRPLNLDPGYLAPGKFVLASTKDHAHRLYLGQGIYGEVTLVYQAGVWLPREWTYPNYRRRDYHDFLSRCRQRLLEHLREGHRA